MRTKVLVLRPHADTIGGVEHYYNLLALDAHDPRFEYLFVTQPERGSSGSVFARLMRLYVEFWRRLGTGAYRLAVLNPSLNRNSFLRDAVFCMLARARRCDVIVFFRGWSEQMQSRIERNWLPRTIFRLTFARVRNFIVLGEVFRARLLRLGCSAQANYTITSTVADDSYLGEFDLEQRLARPGPLRILFLSRLVPAKGASIAVRAVSIAQSRLPEMPMHLTIAGDGPELPALREMAAARCRAAVDFPGAVAGEAKKRLLLDSDIFLFPTSHGEGMPNVILEAMLYGMPVISRQVGGIPEVVQHGVNGFLTDRLDDEDFADLLVALATDPELRRRISRANHRKALANFTPSRVREQLVRIIELSFQDAARSSLCADDP